MDFEAKVSAWPLVKEAVIRIQRIDHDGGQPLTIQAGDLFPVSPDRQPNLRFNAKVVSRDYDNRAVLEFDDQSRWHIRRILTHPSFAISAGASVSLWVVVDREIQLSAPPRGMQAIASDQLEAGGDE